MIHSDDDELRDAATGDHSLIDASTGDDTGIRLVRWLGAGGMSAVLLGEVDPKARWEQLSPLCPARVALKFTRPSTEAQLRRVNLSPIDIFRREVVALGRVMERQPATEFVLGLYGSGSADVVSSDGTKRSLPWLAIEYVDGGAEGSTLTDRAMRSGDGIDPVRALRLVRGILSGISVLHEIGVVHRDLKPDNIFIAGPVDDETPKIADCGIARVDGVSGGTIAALTLAYGGPEQMLSTFNPTERNMLIGPWSDVHAAGAVVWYLLAGEDWCRSEGDRSWHEGTRRTLRSARRLHPGFASNHAALDALDAVLARAAAHRLPDEIYARGDAKTFLQYAKVRFPSMFTGTERFSTVAEFQAVLLPILESAAAAWTTRSVRENRPATAFRPTRMLGMTSLSAASAPAEIQEIAARTIAGTNSSFLDHVVQSCVPGGSVFQPDGRILARFGERLMYFVGERAHKVDVPEAWRSAVDKTKWVTRGPAGGFALVGAEHVLLVRGGAFSAMSLPKRAGGGEVGAIQASLGDGRTFGIVTAETDDGDGGPELWLSADGTSWGEPLVLPLGGDVNAFSNGPYGYTVVGAKNGKRARALSVSLDGQISVYTSGVNDRTPLLACVSGAGRETWGAGQGFVLRFDPSGVTSEKLEDLEPPVALALDLVGIPWLVTEHSILRRHDGPEPIWKLYYRRPADQPPLVGIGFTPQGARALDARGRGANLIPRDIADWAGRSLVTLIRRHARRGRRVTFSHRGRPPRFPSRARRKAGRRARPRPVSPRPAARSRWVCAGLARARSLRRRRASKRRGEALRDLRCASGRWFRCWIHCGTRRAGDRRSARPLSRAASERRSILQPGDRGGAWRRGARDGARRGGAARFCAATTDDIFGERSGRHRDRARLCAVGRSPRRARSSRREARERHRRFR